jgi:hypothetical protein
MLGSKRELVQCKRAKVLKERTLVLPVECPDLHRVVVQGVPEVLADRVVQVADKVDLLQTREVDPEVLCPEWKNNRMMKSGYSAVSSISTDRI